MWNRVGAGLRGGAPFGLTSVLRRETGWAASGGGGGGGGGVLTTSLEREINEGNEKVVHGYIIQT